MARETQSEDITLFKIVMKAIMEEIGEKKVLDYYHTRGIPNFNYVHPKKPYRQSLMFSIYNNNTSCAYKDWLWHIYFPYETKLKIFDEVLTEYEEKHEIFFF